VGIGDNMRVSIYKDEWYPFYVIDSYLGQSDEKMVDVPDELVEKYERITKELYSLNMELEKHYDMDM
jgi:hypothetical protein